MAHSFISIKKFSEEPYSKILGYPSATNRQIKARIKELEKFKIKSICLISMDLESNAFMDSIKSQQNKTSLILAR